ncbi:MAG: ABC1 kinase family protein [Nitrospirota bacterium]
MPFTSFILGRRYKNIARLRHIAQVFLGKGFGHVIAQLELNRALPFRRRFARLPEPERSSIPVRLREAFEELGPTFIKLGQVLSGRPDLITVAYAGEFKKLQDEVPPFPFDEAKRIIESELGAPLEELFLSFEKIPAAAASIAQVHYATLLDGTEVVVKVQRSGIQENIEQDIQILKGIAALLEKHIPEARVYNPTAIVEEFARTVRREMDFGMEADNALKFAETFRGSHTIYIPRVFGAHSSRKVLTLERLAGIRIDMVAGLDAAGFNRHALAENGTNAFFKQVFDDGFFHADPHPGNMFVMEDGKIGLVDFGIVGRLTEENREAIADTFLAVVNKDFDKLVRQYIDMGFVSDDVDLETFKRGFKADLVDLIEPLYTKTLGQIKLSDYLERITGIATRHGLKFPRELILMNKALLTMEGLGRELDPDFDFMEAARPYAHKLVAGKYSPRRIAKKVERIVEDQADFYLHLPRHLQTIIRKIIKEDIKVNLEVLHLQRFITEFDRSTNRISFALIITGIIIASSVIIHAGRGRLIFGYPSLGIIGYLIAVFLGLWLVWGIIRSGRL